MLELNNVTLLCLTSKDYEGHQKALEKSRERIQFGEAKVIWDDRIKSIDDWNKKIIYELPSYVYTDYAILFHADGYVIHPELWNPEWLNYDYIGAPWPLPQDDYSYRSESGKLQRVGNSVSLRSKKLMDLIATRPWKSYYGNTNEDGFICCHNREWLESQGCKFAPLEVAVHFSKEHTIDENRDIMNTFCFHAI